MKSPAPGNVALRMYPPEASFNSATETSGMEEPALMGLLAPRLRIYPKKTSFSFTGLIGASCNLSRNTAVWTEISGGISLITAGVSLKVF